MVHKFVAKNEKGHLAVTPLVASQKLCLSKPQTGANGRPDKRRLMLSEFNSAAHTSCVRSYRLSTGAVMSNVDALRTAKPDWRDDMRAVTKTQARLCCRESNGKDWRVTAEIALLDFLAELSQKLGLLFVRAVVFLKQPWLAPSIGPTAQSREDLGERIAPCAKSISASITSRRGQIGDACHSIFTLLVPTGTPSAYQ